MRLVRLHVAMLCALVATVLSCHIAVAKPDLPLQLFDSFDRAFDLAYSTAERHVEGLEQTRPAARPRRHVAALLRELEDRVTIACDAANARLDVELVVAGSLSPERRSAVFACIERHLGEARHALACERDPAVRAEYRVTCERLRALRAAI